MLFALALAVGAVYALDRTAVLNLAGLAPFAPQVALVAVIVFVLLALGAAADLFWLGPLRDRRRLSARRLFREKEAADATAKREALALSRLEHLSKDELRLVADCLRKVSQTFYKPIGERAASALVHKRLVVASGIANIMEQAYTFDDFAWAALLARRDEFIERYEGMCTEKDQRKRAG